MSTDRIPHLDWQPELGTDDIVGGLDDIDQCIRTILLTPKGSDPHNPPFGSNIHLYIDWPVEKIVGHREVAGWGGVTRSIPFIHQTSTTALLDKIRRL